MRVRPAVYVVPVLPLLLAGLLAAGAADAAESTDESTDSLTVGTMSSGDASYALHEKALERIDAAKGLGALSTDAFGDQLSLYAGSVEFANVDISVPGNNALPVELRRRYAIEDRREFDDPLGMGYLGGFGEWDIDIAYLKGTFQQNVGWAVDSPNPQARCSSLKAPPDKPLFSHYDYWNGYSFHVPSEGVSTMLVAHADLPDPVGGSYPWATKSHWRIGCLAQTANGYPGEAFVAISPSGVEYYLDHVVVTQAPSIRSGWNYQADGGVMGRENVYFLVTKIKDRFGNSVRFTYSGSKLTSIKGYDRNNALDGRSITLTYSGRNIISAASTMGTWTYQYAAGGRLQHVTRPDGSKWTYSADGVLRANTIEPLPYDDVVADCPIQTTPESSGAFAYTVTHPAGATAAFEFAVNRHYRHNVPKFCVKPKTTYEYLQTPNYIDVFTLQSKSVTGPGIDPMQWSYVYGNGFANFQWQSDCGTAFGCIPSKTHQVTNPDGSVERFEFGIMYGQNDGQLLKHEVEDNATVLRTTTTTYLSEAEANAQPFPAWAGGDLLMYSDDFAAAAVRPAKSVLIAQQGRTFSRTNNTFDSFARPLQVTRASSLGFNRVEATQYHDDLDDWVLGQVKKHTCISANPSAGCSNTAVAETTFSTLAQPLTSKSFGKLQQTLTYNADGTLATHKDGRNNVTSFGNWYRGVPRSIAFPIGSVSAAVNATGTIASTTDENGHTTSYTYDPVGRLTKISHPTGDTVAWAPTTFAYEQVATTEHGIGPNHWRLTEATGQGRKITYFDGLWRPVVVYEFDNGNVAATKRYTRFEHDHEGRNVFTSYPGTTASLGAGTRTDFDGLGRVTKVLQDSELGVLETETTYLTGFQTRVENPNDEITTTTSYLAWDQPILDYPLAIAHPESVGTGFGRDAYGKPLSISRAGGGATVVRNYAYNAQQELCRQVEPETGATLMGYDAAGNLAWSASGLPASTPCSATGNEVAILARKVARTYDTRNRLTALDFPGANGDQQWTYTPDGLPSEVVTWNDDGTTWVTNAYTYNKRRMLTGESQAENDRDASYTWAMGYGYNVNGHLATLSYPAGLIVDYAPNALGQPTKAISATQNFATGVSYFPNGALKQFTYGNGIVHTLAQNARGLPDTSTDAYGVHKFLADSYDYDPNGNVVAITDGATNQLQRGNRDMVYDGLDRLKSVKSGLWGGGTATYDYDALDNMTRVYVPPAGIYPVRNQHLCREDGTNRLTTVRYTSCSGTPILTVTYDPQGNLDKWNTTDYDFDYGNRLRTVRNSVGALIESYRYDAHGRRVRGTAPAGALFHLYGQDGKLYWTRDERDQQRRQYVYLGGSLIAERTRPIGATTESVTYQHTDALGSPTVRTSQARVVLERLEYEPYGKRIDAANDDLPGYTGHVMDATTGLTYMQQRYYDPRVGQFWSVDPVTAYNGPIEQFNRYRYGNNNPYTFSDPDGQQSSIPYINAYMRHYYRNAHNQPPEDRDAAQAAGDWRQLPDAQSKFHQYGHDGDRNTKWIDDSGHHEAVFDGYGNLIEDRLNGGTYNYAPPTDWVGHFLYDVLPYILWGNGPNKITRASVTGLPPSPTSTSSPSVTIGPVERVDLPPQESPVPAPKAESRLN